MTASGFGSGCCPPLSACSIGRVAGEPGVVAVECGDVFLSPILPLPLKCGCNVSSLGGVLPPHFRLLLVGAVIA